MLFQKDEIYVDNVVKQFNLTKANVIKHLEKLEKLGTSDSTRHNKRIYMLKINKNELKKIIKKYFE